MVRYIVSSMVVITLLNASSCCLLAADPVSPAAVKWETSLSLGATLTDGNSETLTANTRLTTERKGAPNELRFLVEANYGETQVANADGTTENQANVRNAHLLSEYRFVAGGRNYAGLSLDVSHDDIADIAYRLAVGPSVGRYFIKTDNTALNAEVGVVYIQDRVASVDDSRMAIRGYERMVHSLSKTAKIWESVEYLPTADDFNQYLINAEIGAEAAMTTRLSLRLVAQDKYNSDPAPGAEKNDLILAGGISVKL